MGFFSRFIKKEQIVAVFDIGSGSVGGSVIIISPNKKPQIISSVRKSFKNREFVSDEFLKKEMLSNLEEVAKFLQKDIHAVPEKVYAFMSSPWATGSLRTINRKRKEGFVFTERFAKDLVKEEIEKFKKENKNLDEIIDRRVVKVLLNGYESPKPNGKRVKESEIQVFLSLSSVETIDQVEDVIMKTYHKNIKFTSQMFADFIVVRDIFDDVNDFITLNIDEEFTEVSIIQNDFLVGTASFPYGKKTFIREISKKLNKDISEVASVLSMHKDSHLDESHAKDLEKTIQEESKMWINSLKMVFRGLFGELLIPHNIFLIADISSRKWFTNLLNKNNFPEFVTTEDSFNVILGDTNTLQPFCDILVGVKKDSNLIMQSIFINKINFK